MGTNMVRRAMVETGVAGGLALILRLLGAIFERPRVLETNIRISEISRVDSGSYPVPVL